MRALLASFASALTRLGAVALSRPRTAWLVLCGCSLVLGAGSAALNTHYGIALSHDDARSRLVVARRVLDNATPGLRQLGGVWLPLPQLLNVLPAQSSELFDSGAVAIAISVVGYALAVAGLAGLTFEVTRSVTAAASAAVVAGSNPNLLYLAGTPMVEPLAAGTTCAGLFALARVTHLRNESRRRPWQVAAFVLLTCACLTRYEAWVVTLAAAAAISRRGRAWSSRVLVPSASLSCGLIGAGLANRYSLGTWFVAGGFFPASNTAGKGNLLEATWQLSVSVARVLGPFGTAAVLLALAAMWLRPRRVALPALPLALWAAAVPSIAVYFEGHPVHLRFAVSLLPAAAATVGLGVAALQPRWRRLAVAALLVTSVPATFLAPWSIVAWEARANRQRDAERVPVTACIRTQVSSGGPILASMTELAPYMHRLHVEAGVPLRRYVHEGTGVLWETAIADPRQWVSWILVADNDRLGRRWWGDPLFAGSFGVACEGGGITLLERVPPPREHPDQRSRVATALVPADQ